MEELHNRSNRSDIRWYGGMEERNLQQKQGKDLKKDDEMIMNKHFDVIRLIG